MATRPERRWPMWRRNFRVALLVMVSLALGTTMLLPFQFAAIDQNIMSINPLMPDSPIKTVRESSIEDLYRKIIREEKYFDDITRNPAILVLTYNRPDYLSAVLDRLKSLPRRSKFAIYASQDEDNSDIAALLELHSDWVTHIRHKREPLLYPQQDATAYLAQHYRWALDQLFLQRNHSHVVVIEDDLLLSEDALILFEQTAPLLDLDPSIWCISSWNDLGLAPYSLDNRALFRTDFFPGLGWMVKRNLWMEIGPVFPLDHWDHWMRLDTVSKGRSCIAPRISRNQNIGATGATVSREFFSKYLALAKFAEDPVEDFGDLSYLLQHNYDQHLKEYISKAQVFGGILSTLITSNPSAEPEYYLYLYLLEDYESKIHAELNTLPTPRTDYKGVTVLQTGPQRFLFLIDKRISPFCPPEHRFSRNPSLVVTAGKEGASCKDTCWSISNGTWSCSRDHFQYINHCSSLQMHFPCDRGCRGGVTGSDVPNFVSNRQKPDVWGFCLTSEQWPTCEATHWSTSRLCPCLPAH